MIQTIVGSTVANVIYLVLYVLAIVVLALFARLWPKAVTWFNTHTTEKQRTVLHLVAAEAYNWAEVMYKNLDGTGKLKYALQYMSDQLERRGIPFNIDAARAAVQKAWYEYEGQHKKQLAANQAAVSVNIGGAADVKIPAPVAPEAPEAPEAQTAPTAAPAGVATPMDAGTSALATNTETAQ